MRAQQLRRPAPIGESPLTGVDLAVPVPGPPDLLLEVGACGVCRTDLQICEGDLASRRLPVIPGHQVVGRVAGLGSGVSEWAIGDRAGVAWLASTCGTCRFCTSGSENLCDSAGFTGWDRDGGYASHVVVRSDFALRLPEGPADRELAPLLCGGIIGFRALRLSGVEPGGRLGLFGFGASALLTIQVAVHCGMEVYVVTRSILEQDRALALGAAWTGGYDDAVPVPLDGAVTFAPVGEVVVSALESVDRGGTVAINAIHLDRVPEFRYEHLWWERRLRSVANFTRDDAAEFLQVAAEIPIRTAVAPYPLESANEALADVKAGAVAGAAVLTVA